jgi:DNA polymerase-3 subunit beta
MIVDTDKLTTALSTLKRISQLRNTLEVLDCTQLTCNELGLELRATNLTDEGELTIPYSGEPINGICVNTANLHDLINGLRSEDLTLTVAEGRLTVEAKADSFKTVLSGLPAEEYPRHAVTISDDGWELEVATDEIRGAMGYAVAAASTDSSRYMLNGIAIDASGDRLNIVGTDGRRLQMSTIDGGPGKRPDRVIVLGAHTVSTMRASLAESPDETVRIAGDNGSIRFELDNCVFSSKLLEGNYPNYKQVISDPSAFPCSMICDSKELTDAIVRSQAILTKRVNGDGAITISPSDGKLTISARSLAENVTSQSVAATGWDPKAMKEGRFNAAFLKSAVAGSSRVELHMPASGNEPMAVTNPDNDHAYAVVMPMRLQ